MNPNLLKESEVLELKESFNDAALKTLSAFTNTRGGKLYIGINDDKSLNIEGITDKKQQEIVNKIISILGITPSVKLHKYDGTDFLEIEVRPEKRPISVRGKYYQRVGNTTREITGEDLRNLFLSEEPWDQITSPDFELEDIDIAELHTFLKFSKTANRLYKEFDAKKIPSILRKLKLIKNNQVTNACVLLFGKDPQKYFPNASVKIGRFKNESTIIGEHIITGNLFKQVRETEKKIKSFIEKKFLLTNDTLERKEVWQYPLLSIREAMLNALVHRNYFQSNIKTQIKVYDTNITIFNTGKLPSSLRLQDLKKPHSSHPRNSLVADIFYRAGLIEEWGSGIQRMIEAQKEADLPEPEFEERGETFIAKIYGREYVDKLDQASEYLNEWQKSAIKHVQTNSFIDVNTYQILNGVSELTAKKELEDLVKKNIFSKTENGKKTKFQLKN